MLHQLYSPYRLLGVVDESNIPGDPVPLSAKVKLLILVDAGG